MRHALSSIIAVAGLVYFATGCARPDEPTGPAVESPAALMQTATSYAAVSAGLDNSCVLDAGGNAYCMGYGGRGAVGYGGFNGRIIVPYPVTGGHQFTEISVGGLHVCAVSSQAQGWCWGDDSYGQLASSVPLSQCPVGSPCSPAPVAIAGNLSLSTIDAGNQFTCALDLGGRAWCWGDNTFGQLGDGTTTSRNTPTPVSGGLTFATIRAGGFHACALTAAGDLYCWGHNGSGQLGASSSNTCTYFQPYPCSTTPIRVGGSTRYLAVDAGSLHSCALDLSGKAFCWGNNSYGQLGVSPKGTDQHLPAPVGTTRTFAKIETGSKETCAIDAAAQGFCWGFPAGLTVTPVVGFSWTALVPNDDHRCGVTPSGGAYCWGHEDYGELGDGGTHQDTRTSPTPLAPVHGTDLPPVARIIVTGCTNLACTFDGRGSRDDFGIVSWTWDFGDGSSGSGSIANHTYPASGTYTVILTVADSAGQTGSALTSVTVYYNPPGNQPPVARFTYSCSTSTMKCTFNASRSSDDQGIVSYAWHASTPSRPDKTGVTMVRGFTRGQQWQETLTVTDAQGLTGTMTRTIVTP